MRKRTDFIGGRDLGRIWRVGAPASVPARSGFPQRAGRDAGAPSSVENAVHRTSTQPRPFLNLARAHLAELVQALGHPNAWQRETAQRLLVERRDPKSLPLLANCFKSAEHADLKRHTDILLGSTGWRGLPVDLKPADALRRLHALRTLTILTTSERSAGLRSGGVQTDSNTPGQRPALQFTESAPRPAVLDQALRVSLLSADPVLRENAWRILAERQSGMTGFPEALFPVFAADPNPRARFWFAVGFNQGPPATRVNNWPEVLARLAVSDGTNRWMRSAILSGLKPGESLQLANYLALRTNEPAPVEFWSDLGHLLGAEAGALPQFFPTNAPPTPWLIAALDGVAESLRQHGKPGVLPVELRSRFGTEAARLATSPGESTATRKAAIGFLANAEPTQACAALLPVLVATEPAEMQLAAVRSLVSLPADTAARDLLAPGRWNALPPNTRGVILASMLTQPRHVRALLEAIEAQQLPENVLTRAQRESLRKHSDAAIRERARMLFAAAETGDRMKAYEQARAALSLSGHAANGRKIFATNCASCHRLDREGHNVGPDLFGIRNQPKETILLHIVHPNYEVVAGFNACTIECKDGRELTGLIIGDAPSSVTLRQAQGIEETIPRSAITRLTVSQVSLMPEGLEAAMSQQELADLLACLKGEAE